MLSNNLTKQTFMKTICSLLTALFLCINMQSQELPRKQRVCFGAGIDIGFFYPKDVNDYIDRELPSGETVFGVNGLYANYGLHTTLGYKIYRNWEFQWLVEGVMAPKYVTTTIGDYYYDFWRLSTGVLVNFHIPLNAIGKHSIFIGAGPFFHNMTFKEYNASTIGARFQVGFSINNYKFNPQIYLAGDYASANASANGRNLNLNYSCAKIGVNVNF
jgi:hypothetical protein